MPTYEYKCNECEHEWEDLYMTKEELPTCCPECAGQIERLISLPSNGVVELGRLEMKAKIKEDVRKMKTEAARNENVLANLVGESTYQTSEVAREKLKKERPKIKSSRKKSQ